MAIAFTTHFARMFPLPDLVEHFSTVQGPSAEPFRYPVTRTGGYVDPHLKYNKRLGSQFPLRSGREIKTQIVTVLSRSHGAAPQTRSSIVHCVPNGPSLSTGWSLALLKRSSPPAQIYQLCSVYSSPNTFESYLPHNFSRSSGTIGFPYAAGDMDGQIMLKVMSTPRSAPSYLTCRGKSKSPKHDDLERPRCGPETHPPPCMPLAVGTKGHKFHEERHKNKSRFVRDDVIFEQTCTIEWGPCLFGKRYQDCLCPRARQPRCPVGHPQTTSTSILRPIELKRPDPNVPDRLLL
ncbi:fatty acid desaturase [Anopheles sinensis]|uniref:Fatty acid desaturase n=1 Tax=Anopheles sinensis TaxID=74873 RepID=A0A084VR01_ANOSI|nr:fatty acid desaturase [Anopheles sinensis]